MSNEKGRELLSYLGQFSENVGKSEKNENEDLLGELIQDMRQNGINLSVDEIESQVVNFWDKNDKQQDFEYLKKNQGIFGNKKDWNDLVKVALNPKEGLSIMLFAYGINCAKISSILPPSPYRFILRRSYPTYINIGYRGSNVLQEHISKRKLKDIKESYKK